MNNVNRWLWTLAVAALLPVLQACGTSAVSKDISDDGRAGEVVFPDASRDAWQKEGSYPNLENLRHMVPGTSKDQAYELLGRPHFQEGLAGVREWDYIFHFRPAKGGGVTTCQYKVIFDKDMKAQTFHWLPAACASQLDVAPVERVVERVVERPAPAPVQVAAPVMPKTVRLSGDALFGFGKSSQADLLPAGRRQLDQLADDLRTSQQAGRRVDAVRVTGYTDRLGSAASNQKLSSARAQTVRGYLARSGVPADRMSAEGKGAAAPVVQCKQTAHVELVACLAPNRRVEVTVDMTGT